MLRHDVMSGFDIKLSVPLLELLKGQSRYRLDRVRCRSLGKFPTFGDGLEPFSQIACLRI